MTRRLASALVCAALLTAPARSQAPAGPSALPNDRQSVKFGVIGDTGTGGSAQYTIARLLAEARSRFSFDFVIMLGDNLYGGESAADFNRKFERPYKPLLDAGVRFYATLGNHDDPQQRFYAFFNMEGKRYYSFRKRDVEFFVLDSVYMTPAQVNWLSDALTRSNAPWKIAYFHHPLYSSGKKHGPDLQLRGVLEPLFLKHGVDVVFAGHEHFYERLKPQRGIHYFIEGGSAKLRKDNIDPKSQITAKGFDTDNSFMLVEILGDRLYFETISARGQPVDTGSFTRRVAAATP